MVYAPDFVINAGGLINVYTELEGYNEQRALRLVRNIFYNVQKIYQLADKHEESSIEAARIMVGDRLSDIAKLQPHFNRFPARAAIHRQNRTPASSPSRGGMEG